VLLAHLLDPNDTQVAQRRAPGQPTPNQSRPTPKPAPQP
jgi:hypothetical protein